MRSLADARPARLDAGYRPAVAWPDAQYFTQEVRELPAKGVPSPGRPGEAGQPTGLLRRRGGRHGAKRFGRRMLPAAAAAMAMGVIIALIVVARADLHHPQRHRPGPAISRKARTVAFHDLKLNSRWRGHVAYGVGEGVVYLGGSACAATGGRTPIATLPSGARPARPMRVVVALGRAGSAELEVWPNGQLTTIAGSCGTRPDAASIWLSGVSFPLSS